MTILYWILGAILTIVGLAIIYLKKVPPLDSAPVLQLRKGLESFVEKQRPGIAKNLPVKSDKYISIPTRHGDIPARVLVPDHITDNKIGILIHGGGWCIGSTKTYEELSRRLVRVCGCTLVSLEYSLAPEAKFPQSHHECEDAVSWISQHLDEIQSGATDMYLVGDSAGGNLVVSNIYEVDAEVRKKISHLIPVYPAIDGVNEYYSNTAYAKGYYLTGKAMAQFTEALISDRAHLASGRMSPITLDMVEHFPKTLILTADYDPLRDQGEAYAAKIKSEGADVQLKRYDGTVHAFFGLKGFGSRGVTAIDDIGKFLRGEEITNLRSLS